MSTISRHFTRSDRVESHYQYLVVDVPKGSPALTVTLDYDSSDAIVDLGLVGPDRFGGWSGSERSTVTITPTWATPGYIPGIVDGAWQVVLGLHRVGPAGVGVTIGVETSPVAEPPAPALPPRPERPPERTLPSSTGRSWLAADFHSHTVHSDGALEIAELAVLAASRGLDVLAITDHNTVSHHRHLAAGGGHAGILLVPGQEVTTDSGHANCFGAVGWIDFREPPDVWWETAEAHGGVMAVNHPWAGDCAWRLEMPHAPAAPPLVEMWHSTWDRQDRQPLEEWAAFGDVPIGGSDFHRAEGGVLPGNPTTWLECDDASIDAVLDALRNGRTALAASPGGPVLLRDGTEHVAIDAEGCQYVRADGATERVTGRTWRVDAPLAAHLARDGQVTAIST